MRKTLFRKEVSVGQDRDWLGEVRVISPISHRVWGLFALGLLAVLIAWLSLGTYTRREAVIGQLVPIGGLSTVRSRQAGEVTELLVKVGDEVKVGQPVIKIGTESYFDLNESMFGRRDSIISRERENLENELRSAELQYQSQLAKLDQHVSSYAAQRRIALSELAIHQAEREGASRIFENASSLLEGKYISLLQLKQYESAVAQAGTAVLRQQLQIEQIDFQLSELAQQRSRSLYEIESSRTSNQTRQSELELQLAQARSDRGGYLNAPVSGVVSNVSVYQGQSVPTSYTLLTILPADAELEAEILIPTRAMGFARLGGSVLIKYGAFPFQKYGVHSAQIRELSATPLSPNEIAEIYGPQPDSVPRFRVRAKLASQEPVPGQRLLPGMSIEADILQEKRRIYEWILSPAMGLRSNIEGDSGNE